jgi:xanthine dehydrogenase YagS FAD-binding subunit
MMERFSYVRVKTLNEAISHLSAGNAARVHAGGTDLLGCLHDRVFGAEKVVSISGLGELQGIERTRDGGLRIGALTTISEVERDPVIRRDYPVLAQAAAAVASPQLRNQGTIGGNLCQKPRCWYYRGEFHCLRKGGNKCYAVAGQNAFHCILGGKLCYIVHPSDTAPALVALGAVVQIVGPNGKRSVPVETFHMPPGEDPTRETVLADDEIVTQVTLPSPAPGLCSSYRKVRARRSWDFALAGLALAVQIDNGLVAGGRVVLSGAAPVPWRSREAEEAILGKRLSSEVASEAAAAAMKSARPLKHNRYKVPLFRGLIEEQLSAPTGS